MLQPDSYNSMESLQSSCLLTTSKAKQPFIANPYITFLLRGGFVKWDKPSNYFLQEAQKEVSKMAFGLTQTTALELHAHSPTCPYKCTHILPPVLRSAHTRT